jgi:hypothetical protein
MKGTMHSNAFQSLDVDYLESLARNVGIDISAISSSDKIVKDHDVRSRNISRCVNSSVSKLVDAEIPRESITLESHMTEKVSRKGDLAPTPTNRNSENDENYGNEGEKWIEVIRKSRGKHPRKRLQC